MSARMQIQPSETQPVAADQVLCAYCGQPATGAEVAAGMCRHCGSFLLSDADLHRFFETLVRELKREEERAGRRYKG